MVRLIVVAVGVVGFAVGCGAEAPTPQQRQRAYLHIEHCIERAGHQAVIRGDGIEITVEDDTADTEIDELYDECSEPYWDLITVE